MSQDANDLYVQIVQTLSEAERLNLAAVILNDLTDSSEPERLREAASILNDLTNSNENVDFSEAWNEEDLQDLYKFSLSHSENPHDTTDESPKAG
jgi:hypothetical protein